MTHLMEEAIRRVSELPEGQQDVVASIVLAEIDAEDVWAREFAGDPDLLDELAAQGLMIDEENEAAFLSFGEC
jgi:hypothetical protein